MQTNWTNALASYDRATQIAAAIDSDDHHDAFDAAAGVQGETIEALLATPSPDLQAVATKLQIIHRDGYQHMLAPILADVERLAFPTAQADVSWGHRTDDGYVLPITFPGVSSAMADAIAEYYRSYFDKGPSAGNLLTKAASALAAVPVSSMNDLAAKLLMGMLEESPSHRGENLVIHLATYSSIASAETLLSCALHIVGSASAGSVAEDPRLVQAFSSFRDAFKELKAQPLELSDAAIERHFHSRMDPADMVLKTTPALTVAGVAMKLKRAFVALVDRQWSDHAVFDEKPADFEQHVRIAELYQEMFWRAIEDLDRIAEQEAQS